ncbi:acyl carrier protein [Streptomyces solincola]|uniref:Acyl carrier protein n=1 Tax=Streptomyces solincola TaxID=2100817 RepID=A0A2S9Q1E8_9ACTN|nr:acyl carrier protein [Streptomyces solincola]
MAVSLTDSSIREELRAHLADVLYLDTSEIHDEATFADLSLDSVLGVELVAVINTRYGLDESVEAVFEHPTVEKLADYIRDRVASRT